VIMRTTVAGALLFAFTALIGAAGEAYAQDYGEGQLNAVSYKPLPAGASFSVRPLDNSDQNMILKSEFEQALRAKGYTVADDAALVISFETRNEIGAFTTRDKRAVLELNARGGREGGEDANMRFNLFDSNTGGVFNSGKGETSIVRQSRYRVDISVDNQGDGKRLWQAWAIANLDQSDGLTLTRAMVPALIDSLGNTVKRKTFELF